MSMTSAFKPESVQNVSSIWEMSFFIYLTSNKIEIGLLQYGSPLEWNIARNDLVSQLASICVFDNCYKDLHPHILISIMFITNALVYIINR